jgi:hypothetical protein
LSEAFFFTQARKPHQKRPEQVKNLTESCLADGMNVAPAIVEGFPLQRRQQTVKIYLGTTRNDRTPQGVTSAQPPEPLPKKEKPRQDNRNQQEEADQTRQRSRHAAAN